MIVAIIGLGLIGGSIGRGAVASGKYEVYGRDISRDTILKAKMLNAINGELTDEMLKKADLIIFAINPRITIKLLDEIVPLLKDGATVIDCCGNKRGVIQKMNELHLKYPSVGFIGGHPMAGREFSGIEHSVTRLYEHSFMILIPVHSSIEDFLKVKVFFNDLGVEGVQLSTADEHDEMISYTSQLCHIISSSYVKNPLSKKHAGYSAGSFRDLTRVAKLNPDMWTELFIDNGDYLVPQIENLIDRLEEYKEAISNRDEKSLKELLAQGVEAKNEAERVIKEKRKENK